MNNIPDALLLFTFDFDEQLLLIELKKVAAPVRRNIQNMFGILSKKNLNNFFLNCQQTQPI